MCAARGPFLPAAAMIVAVVMPIMFVLRPLKNSIKTLKLVDFKQILYLLLSIVKNIEIQVMLIGAWLESVPGQSALPMLLGLERLRKIRLVWVLIIEKSCNLDV